jgi:predicted aspartyl protease
MRVILLATALAAILPAAARAACTVGRVTTVPLQFMQARALVQVSINETPGQFAIDTGSQDSILDPAYAQAAHVGMDRHAGRMTMVGAGGAQSLPIWTAHARHIQVGDISFQDWEFPVVTDPLPSPVHIDGLLGADFLHYFDIELGIPGGHMTLWRLSGCTDIHPVWTGKYDAIQLTSVKRQKMSMPIWIDNAFLDVEFDTGAGALLLTRDAAIRAGATEAQLQLDRTSPGAGLGGNFAIIGHRFQTLLIGSLVFNNKIIAVDPNPPRLNGFDAYDGRDGLLGLAPFGDDKLWISFATRTLFLQSPLQAQGKSNP